MAVPSSSNSVEVYSIVCHGVAPIDTRWAVLNIRSEEDCFGNHSAVWVVVDVWRFESKLARAKLSATLVVRLLPPAVSVYVLWAWWSVCASRVGFAKLMTGPLHG